VLSAGRWLLWIGLLLAVLPTIGYVLFWSDLAGTGKDLQVRTVRLVGVVMALVGAVLLALA
jgi:ACR3 family arsenite efflux pump ArsB